MRAATERKGFALPLAILIIAALTATLAAAFSSVTAEIATNSAQRSESRACVAVSSAAISTGAPGLPSPESGTAFTTFGSGWVQAMNEMTDSEMIERSMAFLTEW